MSLSWLRVTVVFLVDIVILLVASHCPQSWQGDHHVAFWVGVGLATIITLLSVITHHGLTLTSGLATWLWDWSADPGAALAAGCTPPVDYQRKYGRDTVGVREYEGRLVTVIAVEGGEDVRLGEDYIIEAMKDNPPEVKITRPGRDFRASPIEPWMTLL